MIFITATGTGIGKTFVTAGLARAFRRAGHAVTALKPVLSGFGDAPESDAPASDAHVLLDALGWGSDKLDAIAPWRFRAPLSPDMAAAREGRAIDFDALLAFCRTPRTGTILIEGVGGTMVPLDETHTVLDWIAALSPRIVLVAGSYLGTISHTLTSLATLRARGMAPDLLVINESEESPVPLAETAGTIARFADNVPIVTVPRTPPPPVFDALVRRLSEPGRL